MSFDIWEKKNADGKGSGTYDFTSLLGTDKKKLMRELPSELDGVIRPDTSNTVKQIWEDFRGIYSIITNISPSVDSISSYFEKAKAWIDLFTSLRDRRKGYTRLRVTPYMHAMAYHVPEFLNRFQTVKLFTGQGVEKNDDFARSTVLHKSNNWDSVSDVLLVEARQWQLREHERKKRRWRRKMYSTGNMISLRQGKD